MSTERPGLYIMVFLAMMSSCSSDSRTKRMETELNTLKTRIESTSPQLKEEVAGTKTNRFYEIHGQRAYTLVDGRPVYIHTK